MKKIAEVMLCKCQKNGKLFGIRVEKTGPNSWQQTWAFAIKEKTVQNETYSSSQVSGNIDFSEDYPGCPYCGAKGWVICDCGKLTDNEGANWFKCGWCGLEGPLDEYDGRGIQGAGDR